MNYERLKKYNVEQELMTNQNKLVKLQIEHMIMQNKILHDLVDKCIPTNLQILKYNNIVLQHEQQMKCMNPQNPPPNGMYT